MIHIVAYKKSPFLLKCFQKLLFQQVAHKNTKKNLPPLPTINRISLRRKPVNNWQSGGLILCQEEGMDTAENEEDTVTEEREEALQL